MECGDYPGPKHEGGDCSRAVLRRVRAVMARCDESRGRARDHRDITAALAYDDAAEWIRRALAGDAR